LRPRRGPIRRYGITGNFREFCVVAGGEFLAFRTGIPGGPASNTTHAKNT